jgi:hypothetical protein
VFPKGRKYRALAAKQSVGYKDKAKLSSEKPSELKIDKLTSVKDPNQ